MADVVGTELDFVAVGSEGWGVGHDAGVAEEDVKAGGLGGELFGSFGDGG